MELSRYNLQNSRCIEKSDSNQSQLKKSDTIKYPPNVVQFNCSIPQQFLFDSTKKGDVISVHVGAVRNLTHFWVILKERLLDLADLMYYIQEVYFDENQIQELNICEKNVTQNMYCVALYEGEFNRALVRKVYKEKNQVEVLFIDYGTISLTDSRKLYYLLDKFAHVPQQAIKAKLAGIRPCKTKWSDEATQEFSSMVGEFKELTAKIVKIDRKNKILKVILVDDFNNENIGDALVRNKFALEENANGKSSTHSERCESQIRFQDPLNLPEDLSNTIKLVIDIPTQFELMNFKAKDEILLRVSELFSPYKIWITLNEYHDDLQKLTEELHETFSGEISNQKIPFEELTEGLPCVAMVGLKYCRAFITRLRMDEDKVNIFCFDFGYCCSMEVTQLYYMYARFADLPQQAIRTTLTGIVPREPSTRWSTKAVKRFAEMVNGKTLHAEISSLDHEKQVLKVLLTDCSFVNRMCINSALIQEQWASVDQ